MHNYTERPRQSAAHARPGTVLAPLIVTCHVVAESMEGGKRITYTSCVTRHGQLILSLAMYLWAMTMPSFQRAGSIAYRIRALEWCT